MKLQTSMDKIQSMLAGSAVTHVEVEAVSCSNGEVTRDKSNASFYSTYLRDDIASWVGDHDTPEEAVRYAEAVAKKFNLKIINNL